MNLSKPLYGSADALRLPVSEANAKELHQIEYLAGLDARLNGDPDALKKRLKDVPDGWRQYRIAMTAVEKVLDGVYRTLPDKTMHHMAMLHDYGEIVIRPRPVVRADDVQIVGSKELRVLINAAIEGHCAICLKRGGEARSCPMRRALMLIAPPHALIDDASADADKASKSAPSTVCAYQRVAAGNPLGEYI